MVKKRARIGLKKSQGLGQKKVRKMSYFGQKKVKKLSFKSPEAPDIMGIMEMIVRREYEKVKSNHIHEI